MANNMQFVRKKFPISFFLLRSHAGFEPVRFWRRNSQLFCANPYSQYVQYSFARLCLPNSPFHPPKLLRTERGVDCVAWTSLRCVSVLVVRGCDTRRVKPTAQCAVGSQSGVKDAQDTAFRLAEFKSRVAMKGATRTRKGTTPCTLYINSNYSTHLTNLPKPSLQ